MDKDSLTFGNYPVEFETTENDIIIKCKGVIGKYSQILAYLDFTKGQNYPYQFSENMIIQTETGYKIACLRGTFEEADKIIKHCKQLIKK